MGVVAVSEYEFPPADSLDKFHGNQVLYVGWEDHLMFCAPFAFALPPNTVFRDLCEGTLLKAFKYHPDATKIDWKSVEWFKSGKPWSPDENKSLAENGLKHKDALRFRTPGMTGIKGSCS